jgi:hypothetical protein
MKRLLSVILFVLVLLLVALQGYRLFGASIHYAGTTNPADYHGANVWYQPSPSLQFEGLFLPTIYDLDADPVAGQLTVNLWEVYSLPPNSFTVHEIDTLTPVLSLNSVGDWEGTIGTALFTMRSTYPLHVFVNYTPKVLINSVLQPSLPEVDDYYLNSLSVQVPEPGSFLIIGLAIILVSLYYWLASRKQKQQLHEIVDFKTRIQGEINTTQMLSMVAQLLPAQRVHLMNRLAANYCEACGESVTLEESHVCDLPEFVNGMECYDDTGMHDEEHDNDDIEQGWQQN